MNVTSYGASALSPEMELVAELTQVTDYRRTISGAERTEAPDGI